MQIVSLDAVRKLDTEAKAAADMLALIVSDIPIMVGHEELVAEIGDSADQDKPVRDALEQYFRSIIEFCVNQMKTLGVTQVTVEQYVEYAKDNF